MAVSGVPEEPVQFCLDEAAPISSIDVGYRVFAELFLDEIDQHVDRIVWHALQINGEVGEPAIVGSEPHWFTDTPSLVGVSAKPAAGNVKNSLTHRFRNRSG